MTAVYSLGNVRGPCPDCDGAITTFEIRTSASEHGAVARAGPFEHAGAQYPRAVYVLLRCAGCGRGALATVYDDGGNVAGGVLVDFYPLTRETAVLPEGVP